MTDYFSILEMASPLCVGSNWDQTSNSDTPNRWNRFSSMVPSGELELHHGLASQRRHIFWDGSNPVHLPDGIDEGPALAGRR